MAKVDRVNQLNRAFTVIFTEAMQSLKPLKEIQKIQNNKPADPNAEKYSQQIEKWESAFSFDENLRKYVNKLNNLIGRHRPAGPRSEATCTCRSAGPAPGRARRRGFRCVRFRYPSRRGRQARFLPRGRPGRSRRSSVRCRQRIECLRSVGLERRPVRSSRS